MIDHLNILNQTGEIIVTTLSIKGLKQNNNKYSPNHYVGYLQFQIRFRSDTQN